MDGSSSEDEGNGNDSNDDEGACLQTQMLTEAKPTTAKFYSGAWKAAINEAKMAFRRFTILHNLFPTRDSHLQDAAAILSKVISDMKRKGTRFTTGEYFFFRYHSKCHNPSVDHIQNRDMNIVVSNRSIIKLSVH